MRHALVIGGTGPTGPFLVDGLIERGYRVSICVQVAFATSPIASPHSLVRRCNYPSHAPQALCCRIEHCSKLHDEQVERVNALGMVPSFQINHVHY